MRWKKTSISDLTSGYLCLQAHTHARTLVNVYMPLTLTCYFCSIITKVLICCKFFIIFSVLVSVLGSIVSYKAQQSTQNFFGSSISFNIITITDLNTENPLTWGLRDQYHPDSPFRKTISSLKSHSKSEEQGIGRRDSK